MFGELKKKKIRNSVSFWATEKFQYSKFISRQFTEHFTKQTFAYKASNIDFRRSRQKKQLLTANDSCSVISIMIYILRLISMPNFSSIRWSGAELFSSKVKIEEFCLTEIERDRDSFRDIGVRPGSDTKINWNFHLPPKCDIHAKFELCRLLGSRAMECDGQTPGEAGANLGTAWLLLGPELSIYTINWKLLTALGKNLHFKWLNQHMVGSKGL